MAAESVNPGSRARENRRAFPDATVPEGKAFTISQEINVEWLSFPVRSGVRGQHPALFSFFALLIADSR